MVITGCCTIFLNNKIFNPRSQQQRLEKKDLSASDIILSVLFKYRFFEYIDCAYDLLSTGGFYGYRDTYIFFHVVHNYQHFIFGSGCIV